MVTHSSSQDHALINILFWITCLYFSFDYLNFTYSIGWPKVSSIDLLLECDSLCMCLADGELFENTELSIAKNCKLGWIISGIIPRKIRTNLFKYFWWDCESKSKHRQNYSWFSVQNLSSLLKLENLSPLYKKRLQTLEKNFLRILISFANIVSF